jgi:transposase InsO family protein
LDRKLSKRAREDQRILGKIQEVYVENRKAYGSPRIHLALKKKGFGWGRHRIARIMRSAGLRAYRQYLKYRRYTKNKHGRLEAPNLVKQNFKVPVPNRVWASDITQFWTGGGWLYLAVVMDLFSRRIIGWSMQRTLREGLVVDALEMAIQQRGEEAPEIFHSDQGSQYSSFAVRDSLEEYGIQPSMSHRGSCYDNAVVESFFKTVKAELIRLVRFTDREDARTKLFEYIEVFYNRTRLHSSLGYKSPVEFEKQITLS